MSDCSHFLSKGLFDVSGKVALVTGGGTGIGLMCAQTFAANGAKVYIVGRTKEKLDNVVSTYGKSVSGSFIPIVADVSKKEDIAKLRDEIASKEKCLDFLVNNAGIATETQDSDAKNAEEMSKNLFEGDNNTFEDWSDVFRTNVSTIYFVTAAFLPLLAKSTEQEKGHSAAVITISSISGIVKVPQSHWQYNASKAAAIHLNKMLAHEIADKGLKIRVNSIAPGVFPSQMTEKTESDENQKNKLPKDKVDESAFAGRPGKEEDMASAVLFLATNMYVNGVTIPVDGGFVLKTGTA